MNAEHLTHRQIRIPDAAPEPLVQLLERVQQALGEDRPPYDTVRWIHDSLAFLTEVFASFSLGALKTVGPYSNSLEQLLKTPASLERSERILAQAFVDWRAHPHHPAYESLREAFFLTSRLQSSRAAPRRYTRWLGVEGRAVLGLEQLSRWSRRLDLLVDETDGVWAKEQLRLYLPLLWIWTDALETFFREWSLQLKTEVEDGCLKFSGSAKRDDVHLQLLSSRPLSALKANFLSDNGSVRLNGFQSPRSVTAPLDVELGSAESSLSASPPSAAPDIALIYDEASGSYVIEGSAVSADEPTSLHGSAIVSLEVDVLSNESALLETETVAVSEVVPPESEVSPITELPSPEELPSLSTPMEAVATGQPPLSDVETVTEIPSPEALPALQSPIEQVAEIEPPLFEAPAVVEAVVESEAPLFEFPPVAEPIVEIPSPEALPIFEPPVAEIEPPLFETPAVVEAVVEPEAPLFEFPPVAEAIVEVPSPEALPIFEPPVAEIEPPLFETPAVVEAVAESEAPLFEFPPVAEPIVEIPSPEDIPELLPSDAPVTLSALPVAAMVEGIGEIPIPNATSGLSGEPAPTVEPELSSTLEPASALVEPDLFAPSAGVSGEFDLFDPTPQPSDEPTARDLFAPDAPSAITADASPPRNSEQSVEAPEPEGAAVAMGAQTEDVFEDSFEFRSDAGPPRPNWKGWGASERESVQETCETLLGIAPKVAAGFLELLAPPLQGSANKLQLVLGAGCGKSYLARALCQSEIHPQYGATILLDWRQASLVEGSASDFSEIYFRMREDVKRRALQVVLPEPETAAVLAAAVGKDGFPRTLRRLFGQLAVLNRSGLMIILDEPSEAVRGSLVDPLPEGLRVISLVTPVQASDVLGERIDLHAVWPKVASELFGQSAGDFVDSTGANLLRVGLACQLKAVGGQLPASLTEITETVLLHPSVDQDFLVCLALEGSPVSLDDLDQWYLDSSKVDACVKAFPSLFQLRSTRLSPVVGLSHASIEVAVGEKLSQLYQQVASKLLGWTVWQLEVTSPEKYGGLQVREIVFRNFCRLYTYALKSESAVLLEWVARNKELQRNRVALKTQLEKPACRWELQTLLSLLSDVLARLVDSGSYNDLRDERAWALSHLGLNQYHLGLSSRARVDIEQALAIFTELVDKERQNEFRPALATSNYRAARIFDSLGELDRANSYAERAVSGLVDLVEDHGRVDLQDRLGIAIAYRGRLKSQAGDAAGALKDLQQAASLLASSSAERQQEQCQAQIELQLELATIMLKAGQLDNAVKEYGRGVQLATQAVDELHFEDLQALLATCHTYRARCLLEQGEMERAQRDLSKSINLRNLVVDEGRLDQRLDLAKEYLLRSKLDRGRGLRDDAARDLQRAVEILEQLVSEGRQDAQIQLVQTLIERAEVGAGGPSASMVDLQRALALSQEEQSGSPETQAVRLNLLDGVLRASLRAGDFQQAASVSNELLAARQAAQDWDGYSRVLVIRGDLCSQQTNLAGALESYQQAVTLLSRLMEQGQTDERLTLLANAYAGIGTAELGQRQAEKAQEPLRRSLDLYSHLFGQRGQRQILPSMLKAYAAFAEVGLAQNRVQEAVASLKSAFDVLGYLEKEGGTQSVNEFELRKAELFRLRARAFFLQGDATAALHDSEESMRNFLLERQRNQQGVWKEELARTWVLRSSIFFALKDFAQAESAIQDAITYFEGEVNAGKTQYFQDLLLAMSTRAENSGKAGKIDRVLEEYSRMLAVAGALSRLGSPLDMELETAKILEKRARVYREQGVVNEAYADYDKVIAMYRKLLGERPRTDLAKDLANIHIERADMIAAVGHGEHAISDYSQSIELSKALVAQGQVEAATGLAKGLQKRADAYRSSGKGREALADLDGAVAFQMQMLQQKPEPDLMGSLGRALLSQGTLLASFSQAPKAAQSLEQAISLFTNLVETQNLRQYSSDLATALITRVSLTGDKTDPGLRQVLIHAVELVTQQAREGKPLAKDFTIDCLRSVVELLAREDFDTVGELIDAVLKLVELVVTDNKGSQDFVKLTDLLLAASAGLIDDRRTARRPHFLALACVSCNREIQMFGKNSLPRLVYCLYELGQALERSKPPSVLNYIGSSFALLGELASQQQGNEDFLRDLKSMVATWRSLPPQIPALANVSRHMLSQLLRLA